MDKLIYLFLLLILFVNSLNTKFMLVSIFCFVGLCIYLNNQKLLIVGLIILYILSLFSQKKQKETFDNNFKPKKTTIVIEKNMDETIIKDKYDELVLSTQSYSELSLILRSLLDTTYLENNKESIDNIIEKYNIKDIFNLSDSIINKKSLVKYNNFLEKITCIKNNDENNINYLDCDNENFDKIKIFNTNLYIFYRICIKTN